MNTRRDNNDSLRYAEYVLGVLDADARAAVEHEMQESPEAAAAVAWWQQRLTPLSEEIAASAPPDYVWTRVRESLGHDSEVPKPSPSTRAPRRGWWHSLGLWRSWSAAATVAVVVLLVLMFTLPRPAPTPSAAQQVQYMVSSIQQTSGAPGWVATMDVTHARMILTSTGKVAIPRDHSAQLWLIAPGEKPVSVGVLPGKHTAVMQLPSALVAQLGPEAILAVSVEPQGGSPTGQPTGPVIAKGQISAA